MWIKLKYGIIKVGLAFDDNMITMKYVSWLVTYILDTHTKTQFDSVPISRTSETVITEP